jgi:hypothetical protein
VDLKRNDDWQANSDWLAGAIKRTFDELDYDRWVNTSYARVRLMKPSARPDNQDGDQW